MQHSLAFGVLLLHIPQPFSKVSVPLKPGSLEGLVIASSGFLISSQAVQGCTMPASKSAFALS